MTMSLNCEALAPVIALLSVFLRPSERSSSARGGAPSVGGIFRDETGALGVEGGAQQTTRKQNKVSIEKN